MQLRSVSIQKYRARDEYPFNLSLVRNFEKLEFTSPISIIVGENGSGKSTLLESLAIAANLVFVGAESASSDSTLVRARALAKHMRLSWGARNHRGFFMRAEDFFGFQKRVTQNRAELVSQKKEFENKFTGYGRLLSTEATQSQIDALDKKYSENPDAFSHGESFLQLFSNRLQPKGVYILDEPEASLSPKRQLALISLIKKNVTKESQFIIATHSPMVMALPGAELLEIADGTIRKVVYEDIEHVSIMRDFLKNPKQFLQHL